ncbi:hypothetical protein N7603_00270 [Acholeplasma vituli]|uniref:XRE family transcriptional regulator n=1 Tax=Paracholeplasma vituli TaxID=69473 RepID=A0ABT2PT21_9MOLU|nr:hypothetical protein [Paracholeplasma vituli]MCU0104094.1 hypothetical protein [Paracholeplasma vituli]
MISREMCVLLDDFRQKKKLSMIKFTDEIVSLRQYKRYLYGTSEMPFKMFVELCARIHIDPQYLIFELERKRIEQLTTLDDLNRAVITNDYTQANLLIKQLREETLLDKANETYFELLILLMSFYKKEFPDHHYANACAKLIGYPEILNHDMLSAVEIGGLSMMLNFLPQSDRRPVMDKLDEIVTKKAFEFINKDFYTLNFVRLKLAREYGMLRDFDKVIPMCEQVVRSCENYNSYYNLDLAYYYLSLSYKHLKDMEKAHHYLEKMYYALKVKPNMSAFEKYNKIIVGDFGFDFETLMTSRKKNY